MPLQLKLGLAPLDKTSTYGTHDDKKRKERNGNVKVLKDPRDGRRKDKLITSGGILIHIYDRIYDRSDEVKEKVDRKILQKKQKKTSDRPRMY